MTQDQKSPPAAGGLKHPSAFEPLTLVVTAALSIIGAIIGLRLITTLGISANTSVIGALVAMALGRVAILGLGRFRDKNRQNLAQTAISSATFGAANALLAPIAVAWAFNRVDLIWPIFAGALFGLFVDAWVLYRCFGSQFLPATNPWPPGVAAAETIKAGDEGGRHAAVLFGSTAVAAVGTFLFALPFSAAGVALIGNIWALLMWGVGLMVRQYITVVPALAHIDLNAEFIPHGVMVGAGVVSLVQAFMLFTDRQAKKKTEKAHREVKGHIDHSDDPAYAVSVTAATLRRSLATGFLLFLGGAIMLALATGLLSHMNVGMLIGWLLFAAVAAFVHEIIVGLAAMHSGWFPAFAVTLIFLVLGLIIGFPDIPMVVLVAYCSATGPAFADMGYDLKAGWLLRKDRSADPEYVNYDLAGKREQFKSALVGFVVAAVCVLFLWQTYFANGQIPPVSKVYADTIQAGLTNPHTLTNLLIWAIPGAIVQAIGGPKRQMGVMLATGLLISAPNACWAIFIALLVRVIVRRTKGEQAEESLALVGAGFIAGDALASAAALFKGK